MDSSKSSLAFWAKWITIPGALLGLLGVVQSLEWATVAGVTTVGASFGVILYTKQAYRLKRAGLKLDGRSIDSLNEASRQRRVNRSLVIQETENTAIISGADIVISWRCDGYCRTEQEDTIEFSIDTDNNVPFEQLACFAYDLRRDPKRENRIRPILVGPDGISKKVAVPFLEPLSAGQPFSVLLTCALPACIETGVDYYTATLSFDQERVRKCVTRLVFLKDCPTWMRVYNCGLDGRAAFLKDLHPLPGKSEDSEYRDVTVNVPARSARIYVFERSASILAADVRQAA